MQKKISLFLTIFFSLSTVLLYAQSTISGTVNDTRESPLTGATLILTPSNAATVTTTDGRFEFKNIATGTYVLTISYVGMKTYTETLTLDQEDLSLSVTLEDDLLNLDNVVVTGSFDPRTQLRSSTAITTLNATNIQKMVPRGTADLLQSIPGTFTDPSAGEVFTRVYARGISAAAEEDLGWYYVSLQEDGLPVSLLQHSYYTPDIFHRVDLTTKKVEAVRGGSAAVTALNGPGGIYNFISYDLSHTFGGAVQLQGGLQGESNPYYRADVRVGGPLGNHWFFNAGGHYRWDDGARNTSFTFSKGGQFKANISKQHSKGYVKLYTKLLNDFTNRWTGIAATNWDNPTAAFGQDFGSTSLLMPAFNATIPDGRDLANGATNSFDPSRGVHAKDLAFGVDLSQDLGNNWTLRNNLKFSAKSADWQTSISNAFVSLNNPLAYFISGAQFPIGQVVFRDARSGTEVARLNNSEILNGGPIEYLTEGSLPNDAIQGTSTWYKRNDADEWIDQLSFRKQWTNHDVTLGAAGGFSNTSTFTQASFAFVSYENDPRLLTVTVENPNSPVIALTDEEGVSNYGGLFFVNARAKVSQLAFFANDRWDISEKLQADLGLRLETIKHKGSNDRFAPFSQDGGLDGDPTTAFDNGILTPTGVVDAFNFDYSYLSYSFGLNHQFTEKAAVFGRYSLGNKAPELNYYFNNFANVPINQEGEIQKIQQAEIGLKWNTTPFAFTATVFWSRLSDIGLTNFEFDGDTNTIFYTPVQFNTSRTIGLEWESSYAFTQNFNLSFNGTLQQAEATDWTVYDAAGTVPVDDDTITDFSGNTLPFNPNLMFNLGSEYRNEQFNAFLRWQFMGEREGNIANAFQLASYSIFNGGLGYKIDNNWSVDLLMTNIFNSEGLANFFGANSFGANANGATADFIQANPDASFSVVPVLPRGTLLKLNYNF